MEFKAILAELGKIDDRGEQFIYLGKIRKEIKSLTEAERLKFEQEHLQYCESLIAESKKFLEDDEAFEFSEKLKNLVQLQ